MGSKKKVKISRSFKKKLTRGDFTSEEGVIVNGKKIGSLKQPYEHTFDGKGYKKLFHFTHDFNMGRILKHGIVKGRCNMNYSDEAINVPFLTTKNYHHDPAFNPYFGVSDHDYYRLTVNVPTDADKLINYKWFDINYANKYWSKSNSELSRDIEKQYIYLGRITPEMITEVKVWNKETHYWDRLRRSEKEKLIAGHENSSRLFPEEFFASSDNYRPCPTRLDGTDVNRDITGYMHQMHKEEDWKDRWEHLFIMTDYLYKTLKGAELVDFYDYCSMEKQDELYFTNDPASFRKFVNYIVYKYNAHRLEDMKTGSELESSLLDKLYNTLGENERQVA